MSNTKTSHIVYGAIQNLQLDPFYLINNKYSK